MATPKPEYDPQTGIYWYNGQPYSYNDAYTAWYSDNNTTPTPASPAGTPGMSDSDAYNFGTWIAGMSGQTPETYFANNDTYYQQHPNQLQAPVANYYASNPQPTTADGWVTKAGQRVDANTATNNSLIGQLTGLSNSTAAANAGALGNIQALIDAQRAADNTYVQQSQDLTNQLSGYRDTANAYDWQNLGTYQGTLNDLSNYNIGLMGGLGNAYNSMSTPLQSTLQANMLTSQAANAYADPNSIAAQNAALGFLNGGMNGALDYESQGAQTFADPYLVAQQANAANLLQDIANGSKDVNLYDIPGFANLENASNGSLDVNFYGLAGADALRNAANGGLDVNIDDIPGARDLYAAYQGSQNVHVGQGDPEAYAAMRDALGQYKALTDPKVTAAEDFIYQQARMKQEQDERANRAAVMTDLRMRGLSGSGMEIGQSELANQQTSQNSMLAGLGARAQAVQRSMDALAGYSNLSSVMSSQANDLEKSNAANRLTALGQYTGLAGDVSTANKNRQLDASKYYTGLDADVSTANKNRQMTALDSLTGLGASVETANKNRQAAAQGQAYDAYAGMRNEGFSEAAYRASSADAASRANQQTQLSSGIAYGNLASTQRDQSFNEAFKRGTAADQTAQFNETNRVDVQKYNQDYAQKERDAAWGRSTDYTKLGLTASDLNAQNTTDSYNAGRLTNDATYGRNKDVLGSQDLTNTRANTASSNATDRGIGLQNSTIGVNNAGFGRQSDITNLGISTNNNATSSGVAIDLSKGGLIADRQAADAAAAAADAEAKRNQPNLWTEAGRWLTQPGYGVLTKS